MWENDLHMHTKQKEKLIIKITTFWRVNVAMKVAVTLQRILAINWEEM